MLPPPLLTIDQRPVAEEEKEEEPRWRLPHAREVSERCQCDCGAEVGRAPRRSRSSEDDERCEPCTTVAGHDTTQKRGHQGNNKKKKQEGVHGMVFS